MKVHVVFKESAIRSAETRDAALRKVRNRFELREVNEKRFARFGILTADVDPDALPSLRGLAEVDSVEVDGRKRAV
ncbi:MAG: hypothetical protein IT350_05540 [Deltaproteobacteria bacterium]|nr:hypothetical protein [Deltaproteobacteria bacterium]